MSGRPLRLPASPPDRSGLRRCGWLAIITAVGTRLAVIADIHGDVESLQRALRRLEGLQVDGVICAGDIVASGSLFAEQTVRLVRECGIVAVKGNHDRWSTGAGAPHASQGRAPSEPYDALGLDLSAESLVWLAALPTLIPS